MPNYKQRLTTLIETVIAQGASDLHLSTGISPMVRVSGALTPLLTEPPLTKDDMMGLLSELLAPERKQKFLDTQEADFSYAFGETARFRGNAFFERGSVGVALRLIPRAIRTLTELNLPPVLESFSTREQG